MKEDNSKNSKNSNSFISAKMTQELEQTQINKFHTKGGTGFAAEDANAFYDRMFLRNVEQVGVSNTPNGPDRIVNGTPIQTKYFDTASKTMNAAFGVDGYRYSEQLLEVPSDQYEDCVRIMRDKIAKGQLAGVSDPAEAANIVKKGSVTYKQARNIAKAGNIDSILYDAKTQAVSSGYTFAISFAISYAQNKWAGLSDDDALKASISTALNSSTTSFFAGIITAQVLRTHTAAVGVVVSRNGVNYVAQSPVGKKIIEQIAKASLGKAVYGAAATNHVAKLLRTNVVTTVVVTGVMAVPDFYRAAFEGTISWDQFLKNTGINVSSVAGGAGGFWACAGIGAFFFGPVGAGICGVLGAISGGTVAGELARVILDDLIEDDAKRMLDKLPDGLAELGSDYLLSEDESNCLMEDVNSTVDAEFLRDMYRSSNRTKFVYNMFEDSCERIISKRPLVTLPKTSDLNPILTEIESSINDEVDEQIMDA